MANTACLKEGVRSVALCAQLIMVQVLPPYKPIPLFRPKQMKVRSEKLADAIYELRGTNSALGEVCLNSNILASSTLRI
eukprot:913687-Prorocentrum_minimum.AAC.4